MHQHISRIQALLWTAHKAAGRIMQMRQGHSMRIAGIHKQLLTTWSELGHSMNDLALAVTPQLLFTCQIVKSCKPGMTIYSQQQEHMMVRSTASVTERAQAEDESHVNHSVAQIQSPDDETRVRSLDRSASPSEPTHRGFNSAKRPSFMRATASSSAHTIPSSSQLLNKSLSSSAI